MIGGKPIRPNFTDLPAPAGRFLMGMGPCGPGKAEKDLDTPAFGAYANGSL
jgi:hypothetical protein